MSEAVATRTNWPDVYFTAEAMRDPFQDVVVVTARQAFLEQAQDMADAKLALTSDGTPSDDVRQTVVCELIAKAKVSVREHVTVADGVATVCVNVQSLTDDITMWRALDLLSHALDQLNGQDGTIVFGPPLQFSLLGYSNDQL